MSTIPFNLLKIIPPEDGNPLGFTVEVKPEFESWFIKSHGLSEWDEEKFNSWFKKFLGEAVKDRVAGADSLLNRSDQQNVDPYSREGLDDNE